MARLYTATTWPRAPEHFRPWLDEEQDATDLYCWEPTIVPGLLQTQGYARHILGASPGITEDEVEQRVAGRVRRRTILDRERPPLISAVIDEAVLHRNIGGPAVMADQLRFSPRNGPASPGDHPSGAANGRRALRSRRRIHHRRTQRSGLRCLRKRATLRAHGSARSRSSLSASPRPRPRPARPSAVALPTEHSRTIQPAPARSDERRIGAGKRRTLGLDPQRAG